MPGNRGAYADLIPESLPGVGYVTVDGIAEPVRVRFSHITDDTITALTSGTTLDNRLRLQLVDRSAV